MSKPSAWSYSALKLYEQCPLRYKYSKIDKLPEEEAEHLKRGNALHKQAELFLKGEIKKVPEGIKSIEKILKDLKKNQATSETRYQFNVEWKPVNSWFGKDVWLRAISDAEYDGEQPAQRIVMDFKTGKIREQDHTSQGSLLALAVMSAKPAIESVAFYGIYIDQPEKIKAYGIHYNIDLAAKRKPWENRVKVMFGDEEYKPNPGALCGWCPYSKTKKGPCKHG